MNCVVRRSDLVRTAGLYRSSSPAGRLRSASSPGFPEDDWIHLELRNLKRANIEAYRDKWLAAQGLTAEERGMVTSTLGEKLDQPHLRDLARNPMQLAILLHLIHVQGAALPEKAHNLV